MSEDTYPSETLELIYNEVKEALNMQFQSVEGLNTKASVVLGFVGVIIGISTNLYSDENFILVSGSMLFLLGAAFFAFAAYRVKAYRRDPDPRKIAEKYLREKHGTVKKQLIDNFIQSFEDNSGKIKKKVRYVNYSLVLLFIGLVFLTLSIIT